MTDDAPRLPENIYRTVLNAMEHGFVFMGPDARITLFNDAACRILGVSADQLKGKSTTDRDWGTIREDGSEFPSNHHPIMVSLKTQRPCYGVVMGIRVGDNRIRWLVINSDVVREPATGDVAGSVATFSDITSQINQKKYLEQSLEDLQSKTRAASENTSYLTTTLLSLVNEIADANQQLLAALGAGKGEPIESARLVSRKAEKLKLLLTQSHA
jgi:PAS domain S-box-containing protein